MVKGLEHFSTAFREHRENYILIGGAACAINCSNANPPVEFRKTEDLDLVLVIEQLTADFVSALWGYIKEGDYAVKNKKEEEGGFVLHRFAKPKTDGFPKQIELFSRPHKEITVDDGQHLTPIETPEELSNFSAILVDEDYYKLISEHQIQINDVTTLPPHILILLKAKAWLGNRELFEQKLVKEGNVNKHPLDIFTLNDINEEDPSFKIESQVKVDFEQVKTLFRDENEQQYLNGVAGKALNFDELLEDLDEFFD
ncbi:TPA: hypothetical protein I7750_19645 [Vibrio vulnificus]|nr:hypothetical protein [Vibrio vulnificus]HAS8519824.1 hypothetical protein [Vibrio vulnificus]